jgi:hypothetical protein
MRPEQARFLAKHGVPLFSVKNGDQQVGKDVKKENGKVQVR